MASRSKPVKPFAICPATSRSPSRVARSAMRRHCWNAASNKAGRSTSIFAKKPAAIGRRSIRSFLIRYIANTIDPATRTFAFLMPLENQYKTVDHGNGTQILWRFRPGQKVLLRVRIEKLDDVFVLPADAVVFEGADAFVFTQNVNTFERKSVHVLFRDRDQVVHRQRRRTAELT